MLRGLSELMRMDENQPEFAAKGSGGMGTDDTPLNKWRRQLPRKMMNFHLCCALSAIPSCFCVFVILDGNSLLLTIQFPDTLTPEVQNAIHQPLSVLPQIQFPDRVVDVRVVIVMCCTRVLTDAYVCVAEGVVGESPLCLIILVRHVLPQSLYPIVLLHGSRPLAFRLICTVGFQPSLD